MKLLTRETDYALRALAFMVANKDEVVAVSRLVWELKIPRPFLRKNLQVLEKKGLLRSNKGRGGGFSLAVSPKDISVLDLIEVFQGKFRLNECFLKRKICPNTKKCVLKKKIDRIERQVSRELSRIKISGICR